MKTTDYPIYRSDGRFSFEKEDDSFELLHPDDSLDGRTELHLFTSPESATEFEEELEKRVNEQDANVSWLTDLTTPDGKIAIIVEHHEEQHPCRGILEIEHPTGNAPVDSLIQACLANHTKEELALGWLRYETLRRASPQTFLKIHQRNLAGERFDDIVTEDLIAWKGDPTKKT